MPEPRRVLAVGAHPDDVEFGCGAILIKEAARGHEVLVLDLSRGESGTAGTPAEREREALEAARVMGVRLEFLPLDGDARLENRPANAMQIAAAIRRFRPHLLLAPSPEENQHPDHAKASRLTRDAARLARYGGILGLTPETPHAIEALYFYDITGSSSAPPPTGLAKVVVDVTEAVETWKKAMACHASQMRTRDYTGLLLARARALGAEIGAGHALAVWAADPLRVDALSDLPSAVRRY
jgi:N-acetylglucosamine malate deacetylase 1